MTDERLEEIRKSLERIGGRTFWDARELLTEFDRLRADEKAMKYAFADRCQDGDMMGQALRLAREEGRLEAMRHLLADRRPRGEGWWNLYGMEPPGPDDLPRTVHDALDGHETRGEPRKSKKYATPALAMAALDAALAKLARQGLPVPEEAP